MTNELNALPVEVRESNLTPAQKKVLNVMFCYNGLDQTKEKGYFFIDNVKLRTEANISSKSTLSSVLTFLIQNNFITRTAGSRDKEGSKASQYTLNINQIMEYCIENKGTVMGTVMGTPAKCTNEKCTNEDIENQQVEGYSYGYSSKGTPAKCTNEKCTNEILEQLKAIRLENKQLREEIKELKNLLWKGTVMGTVNGMGTPQKCTNQNIDNQQVEGYSYGYSSKGTVLDRCTTETDIYINNKSILHTSNNNTSILDLKKEKNKKEKVEVSGENGNNPNDGKNLISNININPDNDTNPQEVNKAAVTASNSENDKLHNPNTENVTEGKYEGQEQRNANSNVDGNKKKLWFNLDQFRTNVDEYIKTNNGQMLIEYSNCLSNAIKEGILTPRQIETFGKSLKRKLDDAIYENRKNGNIPINVVTEEFKEKMEADKLELIQAECKEEINTQLQRFRNGLQGIESCERRGDTAKDVHKDFIKKANEFFDTINEGEMESWQIQDLIKLRARWEQYQANYKVSGKYTVV